MNVPRLNIPTRTPGTESSLPTPLSRIPQWLESLPVANLNEAATQLLTLLQRLNRQAVGTADRETALMHCDSVAANLLDTLCKQGQRALFPMTARPVQAAALIGDLINELAIAYKIIVVELAQARLLPGKKGRMGAAAQKASHYLAELVVHSYTNYAPVPADVWGDIHQLYALARDEGFRSRELHSDKITHHYLAITLLALCNPYQLMGGEARRVFQWLEEWAPSASLTQLAGPRPPEGVYYVDLASDTPPRYALNADNPDTEDAYAFGLDGLLRRISLRLKDIIASGELPNSRTLRQERDLLLRLERAWAVRRRRRFPRTQHLSEITLASSLSACHYYTSGEQPFEPEKKELDIRQKSASDLELVPEDFQPWRSQTTKTAVTGANPHAASYVARDHSTDIWHQIYVTKSRDPDETPVDPAFPAAPLFQLDESVGGLCVRCSPNSPLKLQVGELVVYELGEPRDPANWRVGAIRWLIQRKDGDLEIGIKRLSRNALAIATRAVQGIGKGSGYFRSLLIPRANPRDQATAIVVPAGVYDVGSVLALEMEDELLHAQLTKMLETTGSYAVFAFRMVEAPGEQLRRSAAEPERKIP